MTRTGLHSYYHHVVSDFTSRIASEPAPLVSRSGGPPCGSEGAAHGARHHAVRRPGSPAVDERTRAGETLLELTKAHVPVLRRQAYQTRVSLLHAAWLALICQHPGRDHHDALRHAPAASQGRGWQLPGVRPARLGPVPGLAAAPDGGVGGHSCLRLYGCFGAAADTCWVT